MRVDDLVALYPRLYHMAAEGSWSSIREHGLLSTRALVELWEVAPPSQRRAILSQRRSRSIEIVDENLGRALIRDQMPIDENSLAACLTDMDPTDWYELLNERVFFFLHPERLSGLLNARSYRNSDHVVLTLDTRSLVSAALDRIELSPINSGFAQPHSKAARGSSTFQPVSGFEHPRLAARRTRAPWHVAELAVLDRVDRIEDHIVSVDAMRRDTVLRNIAS